MHAISDSKSGFVLGGYVTTANTSNSQKFVKLIKKVNLKEGTAILADRGYPSVLNRNYLKKYSFIDKIMHKSQAKHPISNFQKKLNHEISPIRSRIESIFGTFKTKYGLYRTKFLGVLKTQAHFLMSSIIFNLKKIILLKN